MLQSGSQISMRSSTSSQQSFDPNSSLSRIQADAAMDISFLSDTPVSFVSASHKAELEELVADGECKPFFLFLIRSLAVFSFQAVSIEADSFACARSL
jgi:hypothetical protein